MPAVQVHARHGGALASALGCLLHVRQQLVQQQPDAQPQQLLAGPRAVAGRAQHVDDAPSGLRTTTACGTPAGDITQPSVQVHMASNRHNRQAPTDTMRHSPMSPPVRLGASGCVIPCLECQRVSACQLNFTTYTVGCSCTWPSQVVCAFPHIPSLTARRWQCGTLRRPPLRRRPPPRRWCGRCCRAGR